MTTLALLVCVAGGAHAAPERVEQAQWSLLSIRPGQVHTPLPQGDRVTGLLIAADGQFPMEGTGRYRLHVGQSAPWQVWLQVRPGKPLQHQARWPVKRGRRATVNVALVPGGDGAQAGLRSWAHLVQGRRMTAPLLRRGRASRGVMGLRRWRVVDGGRAFRRPVATVLTELLERFEAERVQLAPAIANATARARAQVPAQGFTQSPRDQVALQAWPTWDPEAQRLVVTFHVRVVRPWLGPKEEAWERSSKCKCTPQGLCPPCVQRPPQRVVRPKRIGVGHSLGARYEVDRKGRVVREVVYLPQPAN